MQFFTCRPHLEALGLDDGADLDYYVECVDAALEGDTDPTRTFEQALALADPEAHNVEAVVADILEFLHPQASHDGFVADAGMAAGDPDLVIAAYDDLLLEVFGGTDPRPAERKLIERALLALAERNDGDPRRDPEAWNAAIETARTELASLWGAHGPAEEMAESLRKWASGGGTLDDLDAVLEEYGLAGSPVIPVLLPDLSTGGLVISLFAGIGGWDLPLLDRGFDGIGIEWDSAACRTRRAAHLHTVRADVAAYPTRPFAGRVTGIVASPPCQSFSNAGKRQGLADERGGLAFEVLRWTAALSPDWVAVENVASTERLWRSFGKLLQAWGYHVGIQLLDAADFGVPQRRRRAFLLAHRDELDDVQPTHAERPTLFGPSAVHVSMREALGWPQGTDFNANARRGSGIVARHGQRKATPGSRPAPALTCHLRNMRVVKPDGSERRLRKEEALVLQGFPAEYPVFAPSALAWERQVGNALPPPLAAAILETVLGNGRAA